MHFDHSRKRLADVRGFSIAEILVAIVVFGILAGIAVPQFIAFGQKIVSTGLHDRSIQN
jgi:prepilin-type N-terminal cleavage/methylation domain-containing protein